jgi:reactive intermediate/imine deaminase
MKYISIPKSLAPTGHYSQALVAEGLVFVSGILPINPFSGLKNPELSFDEQVALILNNLELTLDTAGSSLDKLLKVTVYLNDISLWENFNTIYAAKLGTHKPARTVVPVSELHFGFKLELDAIAATL